MSERLRPADMAFLADESASAPMHNATLEIFEPSSRGFDYEKLLGLIALIAGKHQAPISSVFEILGLNGLFVALFIGSAWLFRHAARKQPPADAGRRSE